MTRRQFLNDLYRRLGSMSKEEAEQHLTYYAEMLADRMEEGMSEEEAVASMESVDTIAQRILQDAGIHERSVFDAPVEPAAPMEEFTQSAAKPRKTRRWWIGAMVAALALLVLLPLAAIAGLFAINVMGGTNGIRIDTDEGRVAVGEYGLHVESGDTVVSIGPSGITVAEQATASEAVGGSYEADREPYSVSTQNIHSIQVEWTAGDVRVQPWDGDEIRFYELFTGGDNERSEKDRLSYQIDEGELEIHFTGRKISSNAESKDLILEIPSFWSLSELEIETASADVFVDDTSIQELHVETASGNIMMSGAITSIEADSASGWVSVACSSALKELEVDTASGDVTLCVEKDAPFILNFESGSGILDNASAISMEHKGDVHSRGTGGPRMEVDTASGDLRLMEMAE